MHRYTIIDHTADLGIRVFGETLERLFQNAGLALYDLLVKKASSNASYQIRKIYVSGLDLADLLVNYLRELLNLWIDQNTVLININITSITEYTLTASLQLSMFDAKNDEIIHDIKAVTYHQIEVKSVSSGWEGQIIFDI